LFLFLIISCIKVERKSGNDENQQKPVEFYYHESDKENLYKEFEFGQKQSELSSNDLIEIFNMYAVVIGDNVRVYSEDNIDSKIVGFLHNGYIVGVKDMKEIKETGQNKINKDVFINIRGIGNSNYGWVNKAALNFFQIPNNKAISLSNSKKINSNRFPKVKHEGFGYTDYLYGFDYLDNNGDWVIYEGSNSYSELSGLSMHLKNFPKTFNILIFNPEGKSYLQYLGKKEEFSILEYEDIFNADEKKILDRLKPIYTFYFPSSLSLISTTQRIDIFSTEAADNQVIYSGYINFPAHLFKRTYIDKTNIYIQYYINTPFYFVLYKNVSMYERIPVSAFAVYPDDDIWGGLLSMGDEFDKSTEYLIYLYRIDQNNPDDYTQEINEYWGDPLIFY
jgi:hypothetical protein